MSLSTLPLSYCTNVHPGMSVDAVIDGLRQHTVAAQKEFGKRVAAGLWLSAPVISEAIADPTKVEALRRALSETGLVCYTLNAFPYGDFHSERVKENVYLPDWSSPDRLQYTIDCANVISQLMPIGTEGSISTVPLGFKGFSHPPDFQQRCIEQLLLLTRHLDQLHDETGQVIRLAIEPEPCCVLETTEETLAFFQLLFEIAEQQQLGEAARRHLGVCYDICHQAVEFEDIATSVEQLNRSNIRINKVHITCAIHVDRPNENPEAMAELSQFVEPRYLHQTFARQKSGQTISKLDLSPEMCREPANEFDQAEAWRVHFHVPVHQERLGHLGTTRNELKPALESISKLTYAPHLEVETYTWGVLPGTAPATLASGIAKELAATDALLDQIRRGL